MSDHRLRKALSKGPIIGNAAQYHFSIRLKGVSDPVIYLVSSETLDRFERFSAKATTGRNEHETAFFAFSSQDGFEVVLAINALQTANLLSDTSLVTDSDEVRWAKNRNRETVKLYVHGRPQPIDVGVSDPKEISALIAILDLDGSREHVLASWPDEDGELFFVNTRELALLEVPALIAGLGRQGIDGETDG